MDAFMEEVGMLLSLDKLLDAAERFEEHMQYTEEDKEYISYTTELAQLYSAVAGFCKEYITTYENNKDKRTPLPVPNKE